MTTTAFTIICYQFRSMNFIHNCWWWYLVSQSTIEFFHYCVFLWKKQFNIITIEIVKNVPIMNPCMVYTDYIVHFFLKLVTVWRLLHDGSYWWHSIYVYIYDFYIWVSRQRFQSWNKPAHTDWGGKRKYQNNSCSRSNKCIKKTSFQRQPAATRGKHENTDVGRYD